MAFDYTKAAAAAARMIANFGTTGEIRRFLDTGFDPIAGTDAVATYNTTPATLVTVPSVDSLTRFDDQFVAALAVGKARVFLIAANGLTFNPEPGDSVVHDGKLWEIGTGDGKGGVMPLNPAGTPVMFICGTTQGGRGIAEGTEA